MRELSLMLAIVAALVIGLLAPGSFADALTPHQIMIHFQVKMEKRFTKQDLAGFNNIVQRLDLDGNGQLNLDEYAKNSHFRGNSRGTQGFFGAADMNGDGQMSLNEYAWQRIITDEARRIYSAMDLDHDRHVSQKEFLQNKIIRSKSIAEQIFKKFDTDGNAELSLPEYLRKWSRWARSGRKFGSLY